MPFYALFVAGLLVFATVPALKQDSWPRAAVLDAFFGLIAYAAYYRTNLATLKDWPWQVSLIDMSWGTALGSTAAVAGYWVGSRIP